MNEKGDLDLFSLLEHELSESEKVNANGHTEHNSAPAVYKEIKYICCSHIFWFSCKTLYNV